MRKRKVNFNQLFRALKKNGYRKIHREWYRWTQDNFASYEDKTLEFSFYGKSYNKSEVWPTIYADHALCWDKQSKCALRLPFPNNRKQLQFLLEKLKWLRSDEAYKISNEFDFDNYVLEYPNEQDREG